MQNLCTIDGAIHVWVNANANWRGDSSESCATEAKDFYSRFSAARTFSPKIINFPTRSTYYY